MHESAMTIQQGCVYDVFHAILQELWVVCDDTLHVTHASEVDCASLVKQLLVGQIAYIKKGMDVLAVQAQDTTTVAQPCRYLTQWHL